MSRRHDDPNVRRVFDSEAGRIEEGRPAARPSPTGDGVVRMRRETAGRGGKTVTTLSGFSLDPEALADLARALKKRCGTGGSASSDRIEIQGDHRDVLERELVARGFVVRRAGG